MQTKWPSDTEYKNFMPSTPAEKKKSQRPVPVSDGLRFYAVALAVFLSGVSSVRDERHPTRCLTRRQRIIINKNAIVSLFQRREGRHKRSRLPHSASQCSQMLIEIDPVEPSEKRRFRVFCREEGSEMTRGIPPTKLFVGLQIKVEWNLRGRLRSSTATLPANKSDPRRESNCGSMKLAAPK